MDVAVGINLLAYSKRGNDTKQKPKRKRRKHPAHLHSMEMVTLCLVLISIFLISIRSLKQRRRSIINLPPGPKPYPIIGNILDIEPAYHRSLYKLSQTYGPIMTLHLGSKLVVAISSPDITREIMKNHERFCTLPYMPAISSVHDHDKYSLLYRSSDDIEWRRLRRIWKEHMFSTRCLDASQDLRQEMMTRLCHYISKCSAQGRVVNMAVAIFVTLFNNISASLFSTFGSDYESGDNNGFRKSIEGVVNAVSANNIADIFPILRPFDPQGVWRRAESDFGDVLSIVEGIIHRRLEARKNDTYAKKNNDMLEILIGIMETSDGDFTSKNIKHLLLELYVGSSETVSAAVEWIMTELLRNPNVMSKVQDEVRALVGKDEHVRESDITKLPYLNAVIKETLRHHPPSALFTRVLSQDIQVNGYAIPKHTQLLFNIFAIGRDPNLWADPEKF